jgi:hypothetical protein
MVNVTGGRLTPWQVLAATLTCLYALSPTDNKMYVTCPRRLSDCPPPERSYAVKNADNLLGLQAPEPLARLVGPA